MWPKVPIRKSFLALPKCRKDTGLAFSHSHLMACIGDAEEDFKTIAAPWIHSDWDRMDAIGFLGYICAPLSCDLVLSDNCLFHWTAERLRGLHHFLVCFPMLSFPMLSMQSPLSVQWLAVPCAGIWCVNCLSPLRSRLSTDKQGSLFN